MGELSDLELALLLSIVANEHCLIQSETDVLDPIGQELQLVRPKINFPLTSAESVIRLLPTPSPVLMLSSSAARTRH